MTQTDEWLDITSLCPGGINSVGPKQIPTLAKPVCFIVPATTVPLAPARNHYAFGEQTMRKLSRRKLVAGALAVPLVAPTATALAPAAATTLLTPDPLVARPAPGRPKTTGAKP